MPEAVYILALLALAVGAIYRLGHRHGRARGYREGFDKGLDVGTEDAMGAIHVAAAKHRRAGAGEAIHLLRKRRIVDTKITS